MHVGVARGVRSWGRACCTALAAPHVMHGIPPLPLFPPPPTPAASVPQPTDRAHGEAIRAAFKSWRVEEVRSTFDRVFEMVGKAPDADGGCP